MQVNLMIDKILYIVSVTKVLLTRDAAMEGEGLNSRQGQVILSLPPYWWDFVFSDVKAKKLIFIMPFIAFSFAFWIANTAS